MNEGRVWVEVSVLRTEQECFTYRGSMSRVDCRAVLAGECARPFVEITDTYWFEDFDDDFIATHSMKGKLVRFGEGEFDNFVGSIHVKVSSIVSIAELHDGPDREFL